MRFHLTMILQKGIAKTVLYFTYVFKVFPLSTTTSSFSRNLSTLKEVLKGWRNSSTSMCFRETIAQLVSKRTFQSVWQNTLSALTVLDIIQHVKLRRIKKQNRFRFMNQNDKGKNPDFESIIYVYVFVLAKYWNVIDKTVG